MSDEVVDKKTSLFWYRVKFLSLIGVFLSPFILGWLALYVFEFKPESINYGTLVQPVKRIQWPDLRDVEGQLYQGGFGRKWTFVLIAGDQCTQQCQSNLFYMRQIRTLLGRDTERLQNVFLSESGLDNTMNSFLNDYPDFIVIDKLVDDSLMSQFTLEGDVAGSTPKMYLIDPDQNYMMHYPSEPDEHRVLEDIRKLLKLSKIG